VWVTRLRPKVDRIACPWLIRCFIDPNAVFLFVPPSEVTAVAERFRATPFDIESVFWSQRGDTCTFDTMLEEFDLRSEPRHYDWQRSHVARIRRGQTLRRSPLDCWPRRSVTHGCIGTILRSSRRRWPLRCILSLVPRRRRRDPQLAQQQAGSRRITAGLPAPVRGCRGTAFAAHGPQRWLLPARRYCRGQIPRAQCEQKPQGHTEIALRLREGRRRLRSRRGGKNLGSGVALRYPHRCLPVYVFQLGQAIGISVHLGVGDYGSLRG